MGQYRVIYEVEEIRGNCPLYKVGDKIVFDSHHSVEMVNTKESDAVCLRAIHNMWNHQAWQVGSNNVVKHLSGIVGECRIACPMPGDPYTPCGYTIFRIRREKLE